MISITPEECVGWCRSRSVDLAESKSTFSGRPPRQSFVFQTPREARAQIALSEALVETVPRVSQTLLWVTDWPLYKSHEMALISGIRRGQGESRKLTEAPGHVMAPKDRDLLGGLVFLMLAFGWDSYLVPYDARFILFTSHHDLIEIHTTDVAKGREVQKIASRFRLKGL